MGCERSHEIETSESDWLLLCFERECDLVVLLSEQEVRLDTWKLLMYDLMIHDFVVVIDDDAMVSYHTIPYSRFICCREEMRQI